MTEIVEMQQKFDRMYKTQSEVITLIEDLRGDMKTVKGALGVIEQDYQRFEEAYRQVGIITNQNPYEFMSKFMHKLTIAFSSPDDFSDPSMVFSLLSMTDTEKKVLKIFVKVIMETYKSGGGVF